MKWLYSSILILIITASVSAQSLGSMTYNVSFPTGKLNDYIDEISWRGIGIEGRWFSNKNISFGLSSGWNVFDQRTNELINIEKDGISGTISGTQIRTINAVPLLATAHYYTGKRRDQFRFYFGAGAGMYYIKQRLEIGLVAFESDNWHFGLAPEAGVLVSINRDFMMILNTKYNYAFSAGEPLDGGDDNTYAYWGINVGFVWQSF
ncbi:MAG: OmpW family outer membrane protein [Ignavibacteriaceae bacterium]